MKILAIDPGSSLGWATDATGRLEWGTEDFHIKRGESSGNRWRRFGRWLNSVTTKQTWHPQLDPTIEATVDLIVYEQAHFMPKARAAAEIAAGFTTRLEELCERDFYDPSNGGKQKIALQPVPVQTLKAFALPRAVRAKRKKCETVQEYRARCPITDRSKEAMIRGACNRLLSIAMSEGKRPLPFFSPKFEPSGALVVLESESPVAPFLNEHEADALWLYWYAKENCG